MHQHHLSILKTHQDLRLQNYTTPNNKAHPPLHSNPNPQAVLVTLLWKDNPPLASQVLTFQALFSQVLISPAHVSRVRSLMKKNITQPVSLIHHHPVNRSAVAMAMQMVDTVPINPTVDTVQANPMVDLNGHLLIQIWMAGAQLQAAQHQIKEVA